MFQSLSLILYQLCQSFSVNAMENQKSYIQEMEEAFATIQIEDDENGGLNYENDTDELSEIETKCCLIGSFLTDSSIDFQAIV